MFTPPLPIPSSLRPNGRNEELSLIHMCKHYNQNKDCNFNRSSI